MYRRSINAGSLTPIWVLIAVNFFIFVATIIRPEAVTMLGVQRVTFMDHPWTILSSMFVHGGWWHIILNMLMLYFYGSYLISLVGETRFLISYFAGGLAGNALFLLLANPYSIAVGASGAVFALGGTLVALVPRLKVMIFPIPIPVNLWVAMLIFALISFSPGIAWQAHLGGIAAGLIAGYIYKKFPRQRRYL